jgi:hypothetical protein
MSWGLLVAAGLFAVLVWLSCFTGGEPPGICSAAYADRMEKQGYVMGPYRRMCGLA